MTDLGLDSARTSAPASVGPVSSRPPEPSVGAPARQDLQRSALALAVATMGVVDLVSALLSHPPERLMALRERLRG